MFGAVIVSWKKILHKRTEATTTPCVPLSVFQNALDSVLFWNAVFSKD